MKFDKKIKQFSIFENSDCPEVALSVTHFNGKNYAVARKMPAIYFTDSKIKFYELDENFNEINSEIICRGEDARIFTFDNQLYFISWEWVEVKKRVDIFIFNLTKGKKIYLKTEKIKHIGKNWTFVKYNNNPYIIYSVDPLILLKIDLDSGKLENYNGNPNLISITEYRGGACAVQEDKNIIGLGHYSINSKHHKIFFYQNNLSNLNHKEMITYNWNGVCDPYGFFKIRDTYYASITTSTREWTNPKNKYSNEIWKLI